ncbi:serine/threonine-protein kinase Nek5 [Cephus cinctus]|uniref:non-specific serine/threonine protein kinase n=1 Tax=Cephus cinctus TaxID=211228 RepID=A0AAJ7BV31_CEPCN|nr:serine/threonine-protein kinase Nek5 [Cephus cinctus]
MRTSDFIFKEKLGTGAFGACYLATYKPNQRWYVIKKQSMEHVEIVMNEVKLLSKMEHTNIITYYGSWIENNKCFILMEYATKGTLYNLLSRRQHPLQQRDALYLFAQITLGVHHIHKQNVLHRDLKPGNIMLTGQNADVIKIGDFGISKRINREDAQTRVGTRMYMAPEVLRGHRYGYKCDIWSMGIILYEMLTLKFPFASNSHVGMITRILEMKPSKLPATVSEDCVRMLSKMLQKDPQDRPPSRYLVLCPLLLHSISKVYLNVGRVDRAQC